MMKKQNENVHLKMGTEVQNAQNPFSGQLNQNI